jgi:hypothetical protein
MSEPKRLSHGYAPASHEELDALITGNGLQLLLRIRRDCDQRETDGHIAKRHLEAVAVAHGMSADAQRAGLAELSKAKLIRKARDGYQDLNFLEWCRPAEKREVRRKQFRAASKRYRNRPASTDDSTVESTPLEAEKEEEKEAKKEQQLDKPAVASEVQVPSQSDTITVTKTWEEIVGRQATLGEINHVGRLWLDQYDRLTASQIADTMRRIAARPGQESISRITYFDSILREQNDTSKPNRHVEIVRGEGEPPEDLSLPEWETSAKRATA